MKRRRKVDLRLDKRTLIAAIVIIGFLLVVILPSITAPTGSFIASTAVRPKYCNNEGICIPDDVFKYLPDYPEGMNIVITRIDTSLYPVMENFAAVAQLCKRWNADYTECLDFTPDRYFYMQPDFYYKTWGGRGIPIYIPLGNPSGYHYDYVGVSGIGSFPNSVLIRPKEGSPVRPGMDLKAVTYITTAWGVRNYQGLSMNVGYPRRGTTAVGTFEVEQDPKVVKNYFDVEVTPKEFVLGRTFPVFESENGCIPIAGLSTQPPCRDWVQKVTVIIHIKPNTPPGKYLISLNPGSPSKESETRWGNMYGFRYYSFGNFGVEPPFYQIFIEVGK
ncbi:MAG: hypothetical protein ACE5J4_01590 [Candidatus Aenigmatarchaeota archaeon]